jgi:hypothetical protein
MDWKNRVPSVLGGDPFSLETSFAFAEDGERSAEKRSA